MNAYLLAAIGLLTTAIAVLGWRYDSQHKELAAARARLEQVQNNGTTEVRYVEKIKEVPGPTVIRDRLVHGLCEPAGVHGEPGADAAAGADAAHRLPDESERFAGELSKELASVARNQAQLDALHEELKSQVK